MTGLCRVCHQLVSGLPCGELNERTEREMASLGHSALEHLVRCHPQVGAELNGVLSMCADYMAVLVLELPSEFTQVREAFRAAIGAALDVLARPVPLFPGTHPSPSESRSGP